jgi:DNA-binding CsgD family transcriptional regulator
MTHRSFNKFVVRLESIGVRAKVEKYALSYRITLRELYEGPNRAPSITAARRDVYLWLMAGGKGNNEIARLFDRTPSSVSSLTREKRL